MEPNSNYSQAVFWIDVEKIKPNPYQPRKNFDEEALRGLADSIRQYGVLQPLVVSRSETYRDDGGITVEYELIAGERRLRAAKIAGLAQIPALIREREDNDKAKLEIAIIENLQREDLNPVDRARAFAQLHTEFNLQHTEIAKKIGRSREYVSNTVRLLGLPEWILESLRAGKISEGHARPMLMLNDRPEEQQKLFEQILAGGVTVREAELLSRRIARDKIRKPDRIFDRDTMFLEEKLAERLGTRVRIEKKNKGGKIMIEFFSSGDLDNILRVIEGAEALVADESEETPEEMEQYRSAALGEEKKAPASAEEGNESAPESTQGETPEEQPSRREGGDDDLYSVRNFSI